MYTEKFDCTANLKHHIESSHGKNVEILVSRPSSINISNQKISSQKVSKAAEVEVTSKNFNEDYTCEKCGKTFTSKVNLLEHRKLHCDVCSQLFPNILFLKKHETISGHY